MDALLIRPPRLVEDGVCIYVYVRVLVRARVGAVNVCVLVLTVFKAGGSLAHICHETCVCGGERDM